MLKNKEWFLKGIHDGTPIALGYLAVSFTLGIVAKKSGLTAVQAGLTAFLTNASAGGYVGFTLIAASASYLEMALTQLIINARYLLMSCALSQKLSPDTSLFHRMLIAFDVTDEIFGISISVSGPLNPFYNYGAMAVAIPGWTLGTVLGVLTNGPCKCFKCWSIRNVLSNCDPPCAEKQSNCSIGDPFNGVFFCFFTAAAVIFYFFRHTGHCPNGGNFSHCSAPFSNQGE